MSVYRFVPYDVASHRGIPGRVDGAGFYETGYGWRLIHLARNQGRLVWSGYRASGDPYLGQGARPDQLHYVPYEAVVDVVSEHSGPGDDDKVYVGRVSLTEGFTPKSLVEAAARREHGFVLVYRGGRTFADVQRPLFV